MNICYQKIYDRLKKEFQLCMSTETSRKEYNPVKSSYELGVINDVCVVSTNVMSAKTIDGNVLTKVISIDDITGEQHENYIYVRKDNIAPICMSDLGVTNIRCALMACLCVETIFNTSKKLKVGFIGNGKINQKTCEVLHSLFGFDDFVICGSKNNRAKNKGEFEKYGKVVVDEGNQEELSKCKVIFCCTNSTDKEDLISNKKLKKVKLIISQDGGYALDESFRKERVIYTDHKEQLLEHYKSEFPFDVSQYRISQLSGCNRSNRKIIVHLYGIALADAIVFEELFIKGE